MKNEELAKKSEKMVSTDGGIFLGVSPAFKGAVGKHACASCAHA